MSDEAADDEMSEHWWPPQWLTLTVLVALGLASVTAATAWYEINDARNDAQHECLQVVEFRRETRAMWLELFEAFPEAAVASGLTVDLEALLPPLRCDGTTPVPIP